MLGEVEQSSLPPTSVHDGYGGLVLNSHLRDTSTQEREMVCHSIPQSGRVPEFWDMIFSTKWTTVVVMIDKAKRKKEVVAYLFSFQTKIHQISI